MPQRHSHLLCHHQKNWYKFGPSSFRIFRTAVDLSHPTSGIISRTSFPLWIFKDGTFAFKNSEKTVFSISYPSQMDGKGVRLLLHKNALFCSNPFTYHFVEFHQLRQRVLDLLMHKLKGGTAYLKSVTSCVIYTINQNPFFKSSSPLPLIIPTLNEVLFPSSLIKFLVFSGRKHKSGSFLIGTSVPSKSKRKKTFST